jgi:biotin carboxyl carrier protein
MKYEVTVNGKVYQVEVNRDGQVVLDGQIMAVDFSQIGSGLYSLLVNNESFEALVEGQNSDWRVLLMGDLYEVQVADERDQMIRARSTLSVPDTGELAIKAPLPGLVVQVPVSVGQAVSKGDKLVILESMKMENELRAPRDGKIERVNVEAGQSVEQGQTLVVIV